jgi:hypothetical protein
VNGGARGRGIQGRSPGKGSENNGRHVAARTEWDMIRTNNVGRMAYIGIPTLGDDRVILRTYSPPFCT